MNEYAVFWRDSAEPRSLYAGGLAIGDARIRLRGSAGGTPIVDDVPRESIAAVEPVVEERWIAGFPSFRLDLSTGRSLLLASVVGAGVFVELLDALTTMFSGA